MGRGLTGNVLTGLFSEVAINSAGNNYLILGNADQLDIQVLVDLTVMAYMMAITYIMERRERIYRENK
ncbi:MAG: hypothetical protein ABR986_11115 [Methanomassiliicoccales archaeon]|jgi:ammonia channel protein AmtB